MIPCIPLHSEHDERVIYAPPIVFRASKIYMAYIDMIEVWMHRLNRLKLFTDMDGASKFKFAAEVSWLDLLMQPE